MVSVVLPTHNGAKYLDASVSSILRQTLRDLEFIIVDDASTDATSDVLSRISDDRLVLLRHQVNLGYPVAMNTGLARARGTYIARMDADDESLPDRLQKQVDFLRRNRDYGLVGSKFSFLTPRGYDVPAGAASSNNGWIEITWDQLMAGKRQFPDPSVLVLAEAVKRAGLYRTYQRSGQDVDLWLRILELGYRAAQLESVCYKYRISLNSISASPETSRKNKIPRILAQERIQRGSDRVMRGESIEHLLDETTTQRGKYWHIVDAWTNARRCLAAGDFKSSLEFAWKGARSGGVRRVNLTNAFHYFLHLATGPSHSGPTTQSRP